MTLAPNDSIATRQSLLGRLSNLDDNESWRKFFDTYWKLIYNVARRSGLDDAVAQDVVQDTIIAVAREMPRFHYDPARGSFKQWLFRITRRRVCDQLRRAYRQPPRADISIESLEDEAATEDLAAISDARSSTPPGTRSGNSKSSTTHRTRSDAMSLYVHAKSEALWSERQNSATAAGEAQRRTPRD
jgi:RNA polymerase sigma factor (sigma-70 family)